MATVSDAMSRIALCFCIHFYTRRNEFCSEIHIETVTTNDGHNRGVLFNAHNRDTRYLLIFVQSIAIVVSWTSRSLDILLNWASVWNCSIFLWRTWRHEITVVDCRFSSQNGDGVGRKVASYYISRTFLLVKVNSVREYISRLFNQTTSDRRRVWFSAYDRDYQFIDLCEKCDNQRAESSSVGVKLSPYFKFFTHIWKWQILTTL